jgi:hypothetical protein
MKLSSKRFFYIMVALLVLCVGGGGAVVYFANTLLQQRSKNVVDLKLQNKELEEQLIAYQSAKKDVEKYSYLNEMIDSALPQDKSMRLGNRPESL